MNGFGRGCFREERPIATRKCLSRQTEWLSFQTNELVKEWQKEDESERERRKKWCQPLQLLLQKNFRTKVHARLHARSLTNSLKVTQRERKNVKERRERDGNQWSIPCFRSSSREVRSVPEGTHLSPSRAVLEWERPENGVVTGDAWLLRLLLLLVVGYSFYWLTLAQTAAVVVVSHSSWLSYSLHYYFFLSLSLLKGAFNYREKYRYTTIISSITWKLIQIQLKRI